MNHLSYSGKVRVLQIVILFITDCYCLVFENAVNFVNAFRTAFLTTILSRLYFVTAQVDKLLRHD